MMAPMANQAPSGIFITSLQQSCTARRDGKERGINHFSVIFVIVCWTGSCARCCETQKLNTSHRRCADDTVPLEASCGVLRRACFHRTAFFRTLTLPSSLKSATGRTTFPTLGGIHKHDIDIASEGVRVFRDFHGRLRVCAGLLTASICGRMIKFSTDVLRLLVSSAGCRLD